LAADFFREPQLTPVLRWLGLTFLFKSIGSVHNVLLERELDFKKKTTAELTSSIIKAVISIGMAIAGFGVWSLVIGQLTGIAITSALLWYMVPWRPNLSWDSSVARELFSYGFSIMGVNSLTAWEDNFDYLVIGRIFNTTALGIYTIAYRLPETLVLNTMWAMTAVLFPAFSALQDEKETLKKSFLSTVRYVETLVVPICLGMIIAADPIIRVAFGEEWVEAIPILQVISLYTLVISIGFHAGDVYKAIGRPDILLKLSLVFFPIRLLLLWIGAQYSLIGVAFGHLTVELIAVLVNFFVIKKMIGISFIELIAELKAFLGGALLAAFAIPVLILSKGQAPLIRLIATALAGGAGYLSYLWFSERELIIRAFDMLGIEFPIKK
jgi:PST family polysaccharide transporter